MTENENPMNENYDSEMEATMESVSDTMEAFLASAHVDAVFGEPIQHGANLIIPAAEVFTAGGFGYGFGQSQETKDPAGGGGGGGGGTVQARPIAVIVADGERVKIHPVFDVTKMAIAGITTFGVMLTTYLRLIRKSRG